MKISYKILIGCGICIGLIIALILMNFTQEMYIAAIVIISVIVTFLGLAYYEELQEKQQK